MLSPEAFRATAFQTMRLRDLMTGNPHELYRGPNEATAVRILQGDNANPWIRQAKDDPRELLGLQTGRSNQELNINAEFWEARISKEGGKTRNDVRTDVTYWIRFEGDSHLTRCRAVKRTEQSNRSWTLLLEVNKVL